MRLTFISPFGLTPKATLSHRILPIAKALRKKGHDVLVVSPPYTNPEASGLIENHTGVRLVNITLPGHAFYSLRIGLRLARVVRGFNPERVYIFKPKGYSALAGMILWFMKRCPFYLDIDDLESDKDLAKRMGYCRWERKFFRYQERWLLKRAEKVTVASRYLMKFYEEKLGKEKIQYLPNGPINCRAPFAGAPLHCAIPFGEAALRSTLPIAPRNDRAIQGKRIVLLYTRFTECLLKDIVDFVRLFSKRCPEGVLLVVGEGYGPAPRGMQGSREREKVAGEIEKEGLSDFVVFTGWVKREKLKRYLSPGEVAIYPMADTDFNRAKCSAKLIELMAMGKTIVASPVGEVLTYIRNGESGILAKNIEEMVDKVIELLEDREKAGKIGEGARRFLYNNFNWDKLVRGL